MKRYILPLAVAVSVAVTSVGIPGTPAKAVSELEKINQELDRVKREIKSAQDAEKNAKAEIKRIREQKEEYSAQVAELQKEIDSTSKKLQNLNKQIDDVESNLEFTTQELKDAEQRVVDRDALLKSRLQLLYMNGFVKYLDVLLSSTSFVDFLDRMTALQSIVEKDKEILELNIADKQTVEMKKKDVEAQLDYVSQLLAQTVELKRTLEKKQANRQVAIASLESKEDNLEELSAEQEQQLLKLADTQAKLVKKQQEIKNKNKKKSTVKKYTGGQLTWPVPSSERITSEWGTRIHPITKKKHTHSGIDIGAPNGTTIVAAASGTVILAQWYGGYGNCIIIEHKEGFRTLYGHIRSGGIKVKVGDEVSAGQKIAEVGSTGNSTGNHLHFGVYVNNESVDPLPYLK
ncbi:murein hydrolase activator EnvC family protein [Paenibacillus thermotolerans]|uniref:murein hydrolase activator EnvC family protein n=1 Tax=Paenibacillus thermotolerans TaxID=3027807 RepID=UPI0023687A65|nr:MULTISPECIES: peptidoglycan DD-metalloendopeptidase family protein [unclassified Paenibacillus]